MEVRASPLSVKSVDDGTVLPHKPGNGWGLGGVVVGPGGIAYILGLAPVDGTFLDLKESFVAYSDQSPGHVLRRYGLRALQDASDNTYHCSTVSIYNGTVRGRYRYRRSRLGLKGACGGRAAPSAQRPRPIGIRLRRYRHALLLSPTASPRRS